MESSTKILRCLLDERGVEWDELVGHPVVVGTEWHDRDGYPCAALEHAYDVPDGMLSVHANLTPEQAIAATLGAVEYRKPTTLSQLEAENAKLWELVRDVNKAAHMLCEAWEGSCSKEAEGMSLHAVCPISDTNELCVFGKLYDRMRELRVEVDG